MNPTPARAAALTLLLMINGCGDFSLPSLGLGTSAPGPAVAEAALLSGAGQIALQVSEGILKDRPDNIQAREIKGDALTLLGQYDEAQVIFSGLLGKEPNSVRANTGLGRIKLASDPAAAEALFQQVLKREPKDQTALNNLGIARDLQGRHAEAQAAYRQALAINPDLGSAQVNMALSLAMSGQGAAAIQLLKPRAAEAGASTKVKHDYAVVLAMAGHRAEAEKVLGETMAPDEVRQALDSVTASRGGSVRALAPDKREVARAAAVDVAAAVPEARVRPQRQARAAPETEAWPPAPSPAVTAAAPPPVVVRPLPAAAQGGVTGLAAGIDGALAPPVLTQTAAPTYVLRPPEIRAAPQPVLSGGPQPVLSGGPQPVLSGGPQPVLSGGPQPVLSGGPQPDPAPSPLTAKQAWAPADPVPSARARSFEPAAPRMNPPSLQDMTTAEPAIVETRRPDPPSPAATPDVARQIREAHDNYDPTSAALARITARPRPNAPVVQFSAAPSEAAARALWNSLSRRHPALLADRQPVVIRIERGGMVFWRVRADGFASAAEAHGLCGKMKASGQDCIVPAS